MYFKKITLWQNHVVNGFYYARHGGLNRLKPDTDLNWPTLEYTELKWKLFENRSS